MHRRHLPTTNDPDHAAPVLLPMFAAGTLTMVLAVVAIARIDNDWADLAAVAVLVAVTGLLLRTILRLSQDEDDEQSGDAASPRASR